MSGRKITGLPMPETPKEAPAEIRRLMQAIEEAINEGKTEEAARRLGRCFDLLSRLFYSLSVAFVRHLEIDGKESLESSPGPFLQLQIGLKRAMELLGQAANDPLSKSLRSVFFVGATRKVPTPRRHARLLDLGGIPIRGYRSLVDWVELDSSAEEFSTESRAHRELLRYLPILKEWLTASASFFLDFALEESTWTNASSYRQSVSVGAGGRLVLFVTLPEETARYARPGSWVLNSTEEETPGEDSTSSAVTEVSAEEETLSVESDEVKKAVSAATLERSKEQLETPVPWVQGEESSLDSAESIVAEAGIEPTIEPSLVSPAEPAAQQDEARLLRDEEPTPVSAGAGVEPSLESPAEPAAQQDEARLLQDEEPTPVSAAAGVEPSLESQVEPTARQDEARLPKDEDPMPVSTGLSAQPDLERGEVPVLSGASLSRPVMDSRTPDTVAGAALMGESSVPAVNAPLDETHTPSSVERVLESTEVAAYLTSKFGELGVVPEDFDEIAVESDFPGFLTAALNDLNGAIVANDAYLIVGQLQRSLDLMIQLFAGLSAAVVNEIDSNWLFEFDLDGGRFDLELKGDLLQTSLKRLATEWESSDSGSLLWATFYDGLAALDDPESVYLHTYLLESDAPPVTGFVPLHTFLKLKPREGDLSSRTACRGAAHRYLPLLSFWLENATPLFFESEIDTVLEDEGGALSWAATVAGTILDGTTSGLWLEVDPERWNLPRPELAPVFVVGDAPEPLLLLSEELNQSLEERDYDAAALWTRLSLDLLLQYFAGCLAALWREHSELSEAAEELYFPDASLHQRERLLLLSLGGVSSDSKVGSLLAKVFPKRSLHYRALARRDCPPELDHLAAWAKERATVEEEELLVYLPVLRSWLASANSWFSVSEQLFEEPTSDGRLEGVVAYEDDFLEMVDPEYVILLCRETLELVSPEAIEPVPREEPQSPSLEAEPAAAGHTFIRPDGLPPILSGQLDKLEEALAKGAASGAWMGSALEYLLQYFAGLTTAALGGKAAPIEAESLEGFAPKASLAQKERLLISALAYLREAATGVVQESLKEVFFDPGGGAYLHTRCFGTEGPGSLDPRESEMIISYWCRQRHLEEGLSEDEESFGLSVLHSWLRASESIFTGVQNYAEEPGLDGLEEIVVELTDDFFDLVLPEYAIQIPSRGYFEVLYPESSDALAQQLEVYFPPEVRAELFRPMSLELGGISDGGGELLLGAAFDQVLDDDLFSGIGGTGEEYDPFTPSTSESAASPEAKKTAKTESPQGTLIEGDEAVKSTVSPSLLEETDKTSRSATNDEHSDPVSREQREREKEKRASRRRKRKQDTSSAVLEQVRKERLEKARRRAVARANRVEETKVPLFVNLVYKGLKFSHQMGSRCHLGVVEIASEGQGVLKGTVESAHPSVKVSPSRFEGETARLVYQVDPADMPSNSRLGLTVNTRDERKEYRIDELVPRSWLRDRSPWQALVLLLGPSLIYMVWLLGVTDFWLGQELYYIFFDLPPGENAGFVKQLWLFGLLAIAPGASFVPGVLKGIFSKLEVSVQDSFRIGLPLLMMFPTLCMVALVYGTPLWNFPLTPSQIPLLAQKSILLLLMAGLNLLSASLFSLQTTVWWEGQEGSKAARGTFITFWALTALISVFATFFLSY